ncbi:glutamate-rich protein 2-like [Clytia hemisphaerica]|uniref:glutamate-rich protein 2-like n=1 Tax=Clytia hemisphaerica TaxID=252671 RepID=UPI0034D54FFF
MAAAAPNGYLQQAPIELAGEFIAAVMRKDYHDALVLCQALLMLEPNNETYIQFASALKEAQEIDSDSSDEGSTLSSDNDEGEVELTDSSDSGHDISSSDDYLSGDTSTDDSSSSEDESDSEDENNNDDDDDLLFKDVAGLNLLVGGLSIHNKY